MFLAINYSHPAAQLVQSGRIEIDYFKVPDWEWLVDEAKDIRPAAVHFTLEAGNDGLGMVDWDHISHLFQTTGTPYINLHLDPRHSYFPELSIDTTSSCEVDRVFKIMFTDVMRVVERFGAERVIVENSPYRNENGKTLRAGIEPAIITRIVEETGVGLLLDLSHAIITARYLGMHAEDYVSQLPMSKLKEMHFAGIHRIKGQWTDHLSILTRDWRWMDWALERIHSGDWSNPWLLAFEYGGLGESFEWRTDPNVIADQVPRLYERIHLIGG